MSFHPKVRDPQNPYRTGVLISNHVEDRFGQDLASVNRQGTTGISEQQAKHTMNSTMKQTMKQTMNRTIKHAMDQTNKR